MLAKSHSNGMKKAVHFRKSKVSNFQGSSCEGFKSSCVVQISLTIIIIIIKLIIKHRCSWGTRSNSTESGPRVGKTHWPNQVWNKTGHSCRSPEKNQEK